MSTWHDYSAEEICAMLTIKACPKSIFPRLNFDDSFRNDVEKRLHDAGYELVDDPVTYHYDARLLRSITETDAFREGDFPSCEGLSVPVKALLVILWCNLILPYYDLSLKRDHHNQPHVTEDQLFENFKKQWGSRQNLRKSLTTLKQYGFIQLVWGKAQIVAGPRLSTAVDNARLYDHVRSRVINLLVSEIEEQEHEAAMALGLHDNENEGEGILA